MKNKILIICIASSIYSNFCLASLNIPVQKTNKITGHGNTMFYPMFKTTNELLKESQHPYNHNRLLRASPMKQVPESDIKKVKNLIQQLQSN